MKMEHHIAASVPVAAGTYLMTSSWIYAVAAFFTGFILDVDHVLDYIREEKKFDMKDMFIKSYKGDFKKLYVIFHAWEYIPLALIAGALSGNMTAALVFSAAYFSHLVPDQLLNNTKPLGYFMTYRIIKKFNMRELFYPPKGNL